MLAAVCLRWPLIALAAGPARESRRRRRAGVHQQQASLRPSRLPRLTRDALLFGTGLALTIHEAVLRNGEPRMQLLILYAGMMGLVPVFRADSALAALLRRPTDHDEGER